MGDVVTAVNVEDGAETALMEAHSRSRRRWRLVTHAVQKSGEYDGSIDADLSAVLEMACFVESAKSAIYLGQSVVYFPVDLGIWCDRTPQISELMNCFQLSSTDGGESSTLLGVQAGKGPQSSSSWPQVRRAAQPLQSRKLGAEGLFRCGQRVQRRQRRDHGTAAQVFLCGHAVSWG